MANSMTGYGSGRAAGDNYQLTVEIRAVNHRFLEVYLRLPKSMSSLEDKAKKAIQSRLNRGKLDVFVSLEQISAKKATITVDNELAIAYHSSLAELASACNLSQVITIDQLASFPGVLTVEKVDDDLVELAALLVVAADQAIDKLIAMRSVEGCALRQDLLDRIDKISVWKNEIAGYAAVVVEEQRQRLLSRISDLLADIAVDEAKLANEIAFFADKSDITEELTRLSSHLQQFSACLDINEPIGRKLEFILQEMLREINTIGSKSNTLSINKIVIDVKSELEKIREQIQNIE